MIFKYNFTSIAAVYIYETCSVGFVMKFRHHSWRILSCNYEYPSSAARNDNAVQGDLD